MTIRKGDTIQVISGKERGKKGQVLKFDKLSNRLTVDGVNLRMHHLKPNQTRPKGGMVQMPGSMDRANVVLVCSHCGKLTRGRMNMDTDTKFSACTFCNGTFDV